MTPGVRRLLLRVLKFVFIPVILLLLGYLVVGPYLSSVINRDINEDTQDSLPLQGGGLGWG